jgi:putative heme transporter
VSTGERERVTTPTPDASAEAGSGAVSGSGRRWRPTTTQVVQSILGLALAVVVLAWGLPHFAGTSWTDVWHVLHRVGPRTAIGLFVLMVASLWFYTFTLTGSLPGLTHTRALILNVCGSCVGNLLPAGGAAGVAATYALCRSWRFARRDISTSIIVTGVWNVLARLTLPVIAIVALLLDDGGLPRAVARGAMVGGVVGAGLLGLFIAVIASSRAATAVGHLLNRAVRPVLRRARSTRQARLDDLILDMRSRIGEVVALGWRSLTFGLVGMFSTNFVLFYFCLNAVGARPTMAHTFAAYALGRLLTTVGVTPGGIGVTETGTAAVLVSWGVDPASATAGVVLFSIYTHLLEIPLGAVGWTVWGLSHGRLARRTAMPDRPGTV